jgi:hypothetical protein
MPSAFSCPLFVPYGPVGPPAPVNLGVRLFANTHLFYSLGMNEPPTPSENAMVDPLKPIFDDSTPRGKLMWLPVLIAIVALTATGCIAYHALSNTATHSAQPALLGLAAAWAVGAPTWFFVEYYFFYKKAAAPDSWELFKHGQQVAIPVWAGIAAALYAVGTSDLAKKDSEAQVTCTIEAASIPSKGTTSAVLQLHCK